MEHIKTNLKHAAVTFGVVIVAMLAYNTLIAPHVGVKKAEPKKA